MTYEQAIKKAEERGYSIHSCNPQHTWAYMLKTDPDHIERTIGLTVYPNSEEFELWHVLPRLSYKIGSGKCGSFMNDEHFLHYELHLRAYLEKIYA